MFTSVLLKHCKAWRAPVNVRLANVNVLLGTNSSGKPSRYEIVVHQILFGEWCATRHSLSYDKLPDWFIAYDLYASTNSAFGEQFGERHLCRDRSGDSP
jgi:hypothetical protein